MKSEPDLMLIKKLNGLLTDEEFFDGFSLSNLNHQIMQSDFKENEKLTSRLLILKKYINVEKILTFHLNQRGTH